MGVGPRFKAVNSFLLVANPVKLFTSVRLAEIEAQVKAHSSGNSGLKTDGLSTDGDAKRPVAPTELDMASPAHGAPTDRLQTASPPSQHGSRPAQGTAARAGTAPVPLAPAEMAARAASSTGGPGPTARLVAPAAELVQFWAEDGRAVVRSLLGRLPAPQRKAEISFAVARVVDALLADLNEPRADRMRQFLSAEPDACVDAEGRPVDANLLQLEGCQYLASAAPGLWGPSPRTFLQLVAALGARHVIALETSSLWPDEAERRRDHGGLQVERVGAWSPVDERTQVAAMRLCQGQETCDLAAIRVHCPDGAAITPAQLSGLIRRLKDDVTGEPTPLAVHCLAGRGRTGMVLAAHALTQMWTRQPPQNAEQEAEQALCCLLQLRCQRQHMVEEPGQWQAALQAARRICVSGN